jgi:hypothetical protein
MVLYGATQSARSRRWLHASTHAGPKARAEPANSIVLEVKYEVRHEQYPLQASYSGTVRLNKEQALCKYS